MYFKVSINSLHINIKKQSEKKRLALFFIKQKVI